MRSVAVLLITIIISTVALSQQVLNIDFEVMSAEGMARPFGWNYEDANCQDCQMDTVVFLSGTQSFRASKLSPTGDNKDSRTIIVYPLEPFQLQSNSVSISGWIKTDGADGGLSIAFNLPGQADSAMTFADTSDFVQSPKAWRKTNAEALIPDSCNGISIQLLIRGDGKVWFDSLTLRIDGIPVDRVKVAKPFNKTQKAWIKSQCHILYGVDPLDEPAKTQYSPGMTEFAKQASEARIIALGETTHGTREFFKLKHKILQYAVTHLGVRIFAIEDNQLVVDRVNRYVLGGAGTARASMYGMFSVWQTQEVHDMISWVRQYNDVHHGDPVEFVGFDIQNLDLPLDSLQSFLQYVDPRLAFDVGSKLAGLKANGSKYWLKSDDERKEWFENAQSVFELIRDSSRIWLSEMTSNTDSFKIIRGVQFAQLVRQYAENTYRGHSSLYRDKAMAENVKWFLDNRKPGTKMVIWAHDYHISLGEHPTPSFNIYESKSMGRHLKMIYGHGYKAYGLWTYAGFYWAQISYSDFTQMECPLYPGPVGSLDEVLHRIAVQRGKPGLWLNLETGRSEAWLIKPSPMRFANHVSIDYGYWTRYSIPYQFDGIFFVDETSAARSYTR